MKPTYELQFVAPTALVVWLVHDALYGEETDSRYPLTEEEERIGVKNIQRALEALEKVAASTQLQHEIRNVIHTCVAANARGARYNEQYYELAKVVPKLLERVPNIPRVPTGNKKFNNYVRIHTTWRWSMEDHQWDGLSLVINFEQLAFMHGSRVTQDKCDARAMMWNITHRLDRLNALQKELYLPQTEKACMSRRFERECERIERVCAWKDSIYELVDHLGDVTEAMSEAIDFDPNATTEQHMTYKEIFARKRSLPARSAAVGAINELLRDSDAFIAHLHAAVCP